MNAMQIKRYRYQYPWIDKIRSIIFGKPFYMEGKLVGRVWMGSIYMMLDHK